jgi:hypothetical protein
MRLFRRCKYRNTPGGCAGARETFAKFQEEFESLIFHKKCSISLEPKVSMTKPILSNDEARGWAFACLITCGLALPLFPVYLLVKILIRALG